MTVLEPSTLRLTELTDCGGCAAKLGADLLAEALAGLGAEATAAPRPKKLRLPRHQGCSGRRIEHLRRTRAQLMASQDVFRRANG